MMINRKGYQESEKMEEQKVKGQTKNITLKKVMFSFIGLLLIAVVGFLLYFIVTNIESILMLILLVIAIFVVGYIVIRISFFLFCIFLTFVGIGVFLSLIGWLTHWFG